MLNLIKKFLIILLFCQPVAGAKPTQVETLAGYLDGIQTMQANFSQKTLDRKGLKVLQENQGKMVFKKPDLFRWSVETPIQQLIVNNGTKLWVYDIDLEQVSVQTLKKGENDKPAMVLLANAKDLDKQFEISTFKDKNPGEWFKLKPKTTESQFVQMGLYFENGRLRRLQFEDAAGQWSHIEFSQVKSNSSVSDKTFNFTPPKGVDIVGMD